MATNKSYTDIEQSKKLAEILPLESADMYYQYVLPKSDKIKHVPEIGNPEEALEWYNKGYTHFGKEPLSLKEYCIPCWSLTALLGVIPYNVTFNKGVYRFKLVKYPGYWECYHENFGTVSTNIFKAHNPIDACYEMILELNELNLLRL